MKESYQTDPAKRPADDARRAPSSEDEIRMPDKDERREEAATDEDEDESTNDAPTHRRGAVSTRLIDALPSSPLLWNSVAVVCMLAAVVFMLSGQTDASFVTAALGVVAWFINVRNGFRQADIESTRQHEQGKRWNEKNLDEHE